MFIPYAQETFPVPAVMVVTLKPPDGAAVVPVRPAPIVIVDVSGYLRTTIPEPPLPPVVDESGIAAVPVPPPPEPVFAVAGFAGLVFVVPFPPPAEPVPTVPPLNVPAPPPPA